MAWKVILVLGFLVFSFTYCVLVGYFLHCFNEMFYLLVDSEEERMAKMFFKKNMKKNSKKATAVTSKRNTQRISTVRDKDGKSYIDN